MEESVTSPTKVTGTCLDDEGLDPRVQIELEKLNAATDEINRLESTLEEANNGFRSSLNETSVQLQSLTKKLGSCVEKARPYYEAKEKAKKFQLDCQRAAVQYQRANAVHQAARETIALAEERFANLREKERSSAKERKFDSAWQEMLNHATMKIMEAEAQKSASEREHEKRASAYTSAEKEVQELHRKLKSNITKSRPYFNHRTATQVKLEAQKDRIYKLQRDVTNAKNKYSLSLRNLEHISEEIHELRRMNMKREPGVGAEVDECVAFVERAPSQECLLDSSTDEEHQYWNNLKVKLDELNESSDPMDYSHSPYSTDKEKQMNERFSILVHEDDLSISYKDSDTNSKEEKDTKVPSKPVVANCELVRESFVEGELSSTNAEKDEPETAHEALANNTTVTQTQEATPSIIKPSNVTISEMKSFEQLNPAELTTSNFVLNAVKKFESLLLTGSSLPKDDGSEDFSSEDDGL